MRSLPRPTRHRLARPTRSGSPGAWLGRAVGLRPRQAGRERAARGHPGDRREHRQLAAARLVHGGRARPGGGASATPGTARAARRASPRTSTGSPRTTTSTSRCSASCSSSAAGPASTRSTSRSSGSTTCRPGGSSRPSASRSGTSSTPTCRPRRRPGATRSANGSAPGSASTPTGGRPAATPSSAARMAWHDARVSHTANGVYAAMFMAAAHAASLGAAIGRGVRGRRAVGRPAPEAGSPRRCATARELDGRRGRRRRRAVRALRRASRRARDQQHRARRRCALPPSTTSRPAICGVVQGGWDTDTNGAAVGSILGALGPIEERWSAPLHGRSRARCRRFDGITLDELVARTRAVA